MVLFRLCQEMRQAVASPHLTEPTFMRLIAATAFAGPMYAAPIYAQVIDIRGNVPAYQRRTNNPSQPGEVIPDQRRDGLHHVHPRRAYGGAYRARTPRPKPDKGRESLQDPPARRSVSDDDGHGANFTIYGKTAQHHIDISCLNEIGTGTNQIDGFDKGRQSDWSIQNTTPTLLGRREDGPS